jgi:hypothetical protein
MRILWTAVAAVAIGGLWATPASAFGRKHCCGQTVGTVGTVGTVTTVGTVATVAVPTTTLVTGTARFRGGFGATNLAFGAPQFTDLSWAAFPTATLTFAGGNTISGGSNVTADTELAKAVNNLAAAVNENTKALNVLTGRLGVPPGGPVSPGPSGPGSPGGNFVAPVPADPNRVTLNAPAGGPAVVGVPPRAAEPVVRGLLAQNQGQQALDAYNQAMLHHADNQQAIDSMKRMLNIP